MFAFKADVPKFEIIHDEYLGTLQFLEELDIFLNAGTRGEMHADQMKHPLLWLLERNGM